MPAASTCRFPPGLPTESTINCFFKSFTPASDDLALAAFSGRFLLKQRFRQNQNLPAATISDSHDQRALDACSNRATLPRPLVVHQSGHGLTRQRFRLHFGLRSLTLAKWRGSAWECLRGRGAAEAWSIGPQQGGGVKVLAETSECARLR